jgi:multidrug transporter EmrE-like cation transporter
MVSSSAARFWLQMAAIVTLNTVAQIMLKAGASRGLINTSVAGGVAAYGVSTLLYILVLGRWNVSFVYPIAIGATMALTCISSARLLGEVIGTVQWLGIALVVVGIACISLARGPSP